MSKMKDLHTEKYGDKPKKSPMIKFTIKSFMRQFPDDATCLKWLKEYRWPDGITCSKCERVTGHHYIASRKSFSCQECGCHTYPTANTIYHKSRTPLTIWFYVVYLMSSTRCGISAKHIERETGVTYKTAWRMCKLVRKALDEDQDPFGGDKKVEADETYFGAKTKEGKRGRGSENKVPILGIVERDGKLKTVVVEDTTRATIQPIVEETVQAGSEINTDEWGAYTKLENAGYIHKSINHSQGVYVDGTIHTNTIEGFWGNFKMGVIGNHHHISNTYLPYYLAEWQFRYNHRNDVKPMFLSMLERTGLTISV